jgi:hypothetical protein
LFSQVKDSAGFLKDLLKNEGFVDFYWDEFQGKKNRSRNKKNFIIMELVYLIIIS